MRTILTWVLTWAPLLTLIVVVFLAQAFMQGLEALGGRLDDIEEQLKDLREEQEQAFAELQGSTEE